MKKIVFIVFIVNILFATSYSNGEKEFTLINPTNTRNIIGNTQIIGNTVECVTTRDINNPPYSLSELHSSNCDNNLNDNNNHYFVKYIDIDQNSSTFDSSMATIHLPSTYKDIVWAGLFWQGYINNFSVLYGSGTLDVTDAGDLILSNGNWHLSNDLTNNNITDTPANKVLLKIGNNSYVPVEAKEVDYFTKTATLVTDNGNIYLKGARYSAYADVTNLFTSLAFNPNSDINITVANIFTSEGFTGNHAGGDYGAWSLVIIYKEDPNNIHSKLRNNSVYYGYKKLDKYHQENTISIYNLILPKSGDVNSSLSVFAGEGDYPAKYDTLELNNVPLGADVCSDSGDTPSCKSNIFDSKLSPSIKRYPFLTNNNGIDIDTFDASNIMTNLRNSNPNLASYNSVIKLTTYHDAYYPSVVTFTTLLYRPRVCYYIKEIKDINGNIVFQNGEFLKAIDPNKTYYITLFIANMPQSYGDSVETAQNVQVYMDLNQFSYIYDSTAIKNIGVPTFVSQTDAIDGDLASFNSNINEATWHLGIGANGTSGGDIAPSYNINDDTNKAYVKFRGRFIVNNQQTIDLSNFFNFKASFSTNAIDITNNNALTIPQCIAFNTIGNVYIPKTGSFNVVEPTFNSTIDPIDINNSLNKIHTKIVNKPFDIKVVKLKEDNETLENYTGIVRLDIINNPRDENACESNPALWDGLVIFNNEKSKIKNIIYSNSNRNARFRVKYFNFNLPQSCINLINETNSTTNLNLNARTCIRDIKSLMISNPSYNLSPRCVIHLIRGTFNQWSDVYEDNILDVTSSKAKAFIKCLFDNAKSICSRDNFAIRPYKFEILNYPNVVKAGNDFNISIVALDYNNNIVKDYNQTINVNLSPLLYYIDTNASKGAIKGDLNFIGESKFVNGEANLTLSYSEVGDLNLSIKEINDSNVFAYVDRDDTSLDELLIQPDSKVIKFVPDHFDVNVSFNNFNNAPFTYISNDLNMSSILNINISAKNKNGGITKNYSKGLYANDVTISISHLNNFDTNKLPFIEIYYQNNGENNFTKIISSDMISLIYNKGNFNSGIADLNMHINFEKNYQEPVNEFNFTIDEINISDSVDNISNQITINKTSLFRYGRIDVKDISTYQHEANTSIKYEYWTNNGWIINKDHNSSLGDINISKSYHPNITLTVVPKNGENIIKGIEEINISTTHALPYSAKIHLSIPSWLWYHPLAKPYKDPSNSNLDCLTHPCLEVDFKDQGKGWGGVSAKTNPKYNENNRTSEMNASLKKINAKKDNLNTINW